MDAALIERLGEGMRSLSETAGILNGAVDAAGSTAAYSEQLSTAATHMESLNACLLYTSPSPRDRTRSRMPSSA